MSQTSVLYDAPGPRAVRRARIGTAVAVLAFLGLAVLVVLRLADRGQFDSELWSPWFNPSDDRFSQVWELVGRGLSATLVAAVLAIAFSLVVGVLLGVARMMLGRVLRVPVVAWIELFRGLPVVVTIVFVWRAMVELGIDVSVLPGESALWYLVIGLTLYNSVIIAEILRAGVGSLPSGQREAALAVGLTNGQAMRSILLPQAFRVMLPALISQLVVVLKDTSLAAVVGLGYLELLRRGNLIAQTLDNPIQTLLIIATIFIVINYGLGKLAEYVERRMGRDSGSSAGDGAEAVPAGQGA